VWDSCIFLAFACQLLRLRADNMLERNTRMSLTLKLRVSGHAYWVTGQFFTGSQWVTAYDQLPVLATSLSQFPLWVRRRAEMLLQTSRTAIERHRRHLQGTAQSRKSTHHRHRTVYSVPHEPAGHRSSDRVSSGPSCGAYNYDSTSICRLFDGLSTAYQTLIGGGIRRCFCLTSVCRVHRG